MHPTQLYDTIKVKETSHIEKILIIIVNPAEEWELADPEK
jgi:hypothetical protein